MNIIITSRHDAGKTIQSFEPSHMISLVDPDLPMKHHKDIRPGQHLILKFNDTQTPNDINGPKESHVVDILKFGKSLPQNAKVLIHCEAGVSRSTAAGFLLLVQNKGIDRISEASAELIKIRPMAQPNPLMLHYAARLLRCQKIADEGNKIASYAQSRMMIIKGRDGIEL